MLEARLVSRRAALAAALGGALALALASAAAAAPVARLSDEELLGALQNVFWVSAQPAHPRTFYVIAAPWCGVCKRLYGQLREKTGFQARFMPTAPHTEEERRLLAYAILSQANKGFEAKGLDAVYVTRKAPEALGTEAARNFVVDVNVAAEMALMGPLRARTPNGGYGYPILVFPSRGRLVVVAGAPRDAGDLLAIVDERPELAGRTSGLDRFLVDPPVIARADGAATAGKQGAAVHAAPLAASPRLQALQPGERLTVAGETAVDGRKWLVLQAFQQGRPYGYGLAEDFGR